MEFHRRRGGGGTCHPPDTSPAGQKSVGWWWVGGSLVIQSTPTTQQLGIFGQIFFLAKISQKTSIFLYDLFLCSGTLLRERPPTTDI